ncbi:MAG: DUF2478 domain-containing protein [Hyphomicrobiaceae bacterium]
MKLAAIAYDAGQGDDIDAVLCAIAHELRAKGYKLAGAVQWNEPREGLPHDAMILEDLSTGRRLDVSGEPAAGGGGCRLDSYALETVAGLVANTIDTNVDLVILNRFGKQEAARAGFRPIIEAAVANELPVLTGLNNAHRALWEDFTSGEGIYLSASPEDVKDWAARTLAERKPADR